MMVLYDIILIVVVTILIYPNFLCFEEFTSHLESETYSFPRKESRVQYIVTFYSTQYIQTMKALDWRVRKKNIHSEKIKKK